MLTLDQKICFGGKPTTLNGELKANGGARLRINCLQERETFHVTLYPTGDFGEEHEISKADYEFLEKEGVIKRFTTSNP